MNSLPRLVRFAAPLARINPTFRTLVPQRPIHTTPTRLAGSGGLTNLFDAENMADPARPRLQVAKLNDQGLHLSDGLIIPGGVIFVDDRAFLWDVDPVGIEKDSGRGIWGEWGVERFKIFETVLPRPGTPSCFSSNGPPLRPILEVLN